MSLTLRLRLGFANLSGLAKSLPVTLTSEVSKTSRPTIYAGTSSAIFSPESAAGHSRYGCPDGQMIDRSGPVAAHVNLSARQAKAAGLLMSGTLWPAFHWLVQECRPSVVMGEQVASKDGLGWFDLVSADLQGTGYASWAADICSAGVGAPHIRQRLYWLAYAHGAGTARLGRNGGAGSAASRLRDGLTHSGGVDRLANSCGARLEIISEQQTRGQRATLERSSEAGKLGDAGSERGGRDAGTIPGAESGTRWGLRGVAYESELTGTTRDLEHAESDGRQQRGPESGGRGAVSGRSPSELADADGRNASAEREQRSGQHGQQPENGRPGFWDACDWLPCRDGKARPVEPGTFPLANGVPGRVGLLRGYGNAISPQVAQAFIETVMGDLP